MMTGVDPEVEDDFALSSITLPDGTGAGGGRAGRAE
jgi:hypothetical protein